MTLKESLSIFRHENNKFRGLCSHGGGIYSLGFSIFRCGCFAKHLKIQRQHFSLWKHVAVISRSNLHNNLFVSPPFLDLEESAGVWQTGTFQFMFGRVGVGVWAGRSSGRMLTESLHSGKVCIEKNVNADQQERISAAEPGPEHTLSHTGNSGSRSLVRSPHRCDTSTDPLTTRHPARWLRACSITCTPTEQIQEVTEKITIAQCACVFVQMTISYHMTAGSVLLLFLGYGNILTLLGDTVADGGHFLQRNFSLGLLSYCPPGQVTQL